jgi:hypothetical protein
MDEVCLRLPPRLVRHDFRTELAEDPRPNPGHKKAARLRGS